MANQKTFSGQVPLMQVKQQQPKEDQSSLPDAAKFRLNLHTFVDNRSYHQPIVAGSRQPTYPAKTGGAHVQTSSAYKRISFAVAHVPGQSDSNDSSEISKQPQRKKQRTAKNSGKVRLRTFKPSSNATDMHADAWSIVLAHTRPSFVMQMRTVSKFFYHITNTDTIWRDAREHHFGRDMPSRPSFLTERQYASLLDGRGCQNPQCERRETRKVRWVFRLRLCEDCLSRKLEIYKHDGSVSPQSRYASLFTNVTDREQYGTSIIDLLPTSGTWSGKPNAPRCVSRETGKWLSRSSSQSLLLYLKSDYTALDEEWQKIQAEDWEPQRVLQWAREKYEAATSTARIASDLEWWEMAKLHAGNIPRPIRKSRRTYFVQKAAQLSPPMTEAELSCFAAFQGSLASSNPPSERAWDTLLAKILPYRAQAEAVVHYANTKYPRFGQPSIISPDMAVFDQLHERRRSKRKETGKFSIEQRFVLDLAEEEYNKLVDNVADEDLLLLCLRNAYNAYQNLQKRPHGLNFDGSMGEYRLSLDDAKMIVEEIIEKKIKRTTLRGVKVLESLRCMGCTRFTSGKRYSFQAAFEHMFDKHSKYVGQDLHFHRFLKYSKVPPECLSKDYKFPWYLVEWTRSLPLLPTHAEVTSETRWIPEEDVPYVYSSRPTPESAFRDRHAVPHGDGPTNDFVSNFVHAVKTMSATRLDHECIVKVAIKYSAELAYGNEPSIDDFFACIKPSQGLGSGLPFKFRCGACNRRPEVNSHLRCVKHSVDVNLLRKHWDDKHSHERIDWTIEFMDLPSETALLDTMLSQDKKLLSDQANSIKRETIGLKKSAKKIKDQKANALMAKELSMEAFGRLFVKD